MCMHKYYEQHVNVGFGIIQIPIQMEYCTRPGLKWKSYTYMRTEVKKKKIAKNPTYRFFDWRVTPRAEFNNCKTTVK